MEILNKARSAAEGVVCDETALHTDLITEDTAKRILLEHLLEEGVEIRGVNVDDETLFTLSGESEDEVMEGFNLEEQVTAATFVFLDGTKRTLKLKPEE